MFQFQYNMSPKRVFVAVNLPENLKKDLASAVDKIKPLFGAGVRFLSTENYHLTVEFLGYQDDHSVSLISRALEKTAVEFQPPTIRFEKIIYGPAEKMPRLIWLTCDKETSFGLGKIKNFLEKELFALGVRFRQEHRLFNAHLTIARFEAMSQSRFARSGVARQNRELPPLSAGGGSASGGEISVNREFEAESIDLMESHLKRSGAQYEALSKFEFYSEAG